MKQKLFISFLYLGLVFTFYHSSCMQESRVSARDSMTQCLQIIKDNGPQLSAYNAFLISIKDKSDDPGYYRILRDVAEKAGIPQDKIFEMWDEYGITDIARKELLDIQCETLIKLLQQEVNASMF